MLSLVGDEEKLVPTGGDKRLATDGLLRLSLSTLGKPSCGVKRMATENINSGQATEPQQITVEQLAAQLSRKAPSGSAATSAETAPQATPAEEAPAGDAGGTEPDLFGNVSDDGQPTGESNATAGEEGGEDGQPVPDWFQKRIAKFTAVQKNLEERLAAAEKRAEEEANRADKLKREQQGGKTKAWNHQEQQLQEDLAHKRDLLRWAEENSGGASVTDEKGQEVEYTPEQVRAIKLSALEDIGDLRSQLRTHQQALVNAREHWDQEALRAYPNLKDANSEDSRNIELMLEKLPWLRDVPDARISLADMLAGRAARVKRGQAARTAAGATPRGPGTATAAPVRTADAGATQDQKQANEAFQQSGSVQDLARRFSTQRKV